MKQPLNPLRPVSAALFAALALSTAPVFAQDVTPAPAPVIAAPPPTITAPPAPVTVAPPVATPPRATPAPVARTTPRARPAAPARTAIRAPAPARVATPAPAVAPAPAPEPAPIETAPPPVAAAPELPPPPAAEPTPAPAEQSAATTSMLPFIIGAAALLILVFGFLALRRRRRDDDVYEEAVYEETYEQPVAEAPAAPYAEPALAGAPFSPEPTFSRTAVADAAPIDDGYEAVTAASIEEVEITRSDSADIEALAADSEPVSGRPWIEFLMRPLRAGTSRDNAIVQFELTVGNTGSVPARDVRISTWVVAAGEGTDMERSLIEPPAEATHNAVDIDAGGGATVEAKIAMAKGDRDAPVLPVVVADARYTLPDGSEGRTYASFAVGVPEEDGSELQPFRVDGSSGLRENVEARLYGEPERV